tara:strand:- start:1857 stop:3500 length:1644 start_codon:yes stop_codon:yes gene_type:complete
MDFLSEKNRRIEFLIPIFLFLVVLLLKIETFDLSYSWDDFNYVIKAVNYVFSVQVTPFLLEYGLGHPPFFFLFSGLIFRIFGDSLVVSHLITVVFSFLAVYFTYLIGRELFSKRVGIIAAFVLLFTPMFFSFSSLFYLEMPLTALIIIGLYFAIRNNHYLYVLFASLAILTKEPAIAFVIALLFIKIIKEKDKLKIGLIYSIPIFVFLLWVLSNKIFYGFFLLPVSTSLIVIEPVKNLFHFVVVLKILLFDDFRWILTTLFFIQFVSFKKLKEFKNILYPLIFSVIAFFIFFNVPYLLGRYVVYYANIGNYLELFRNFSLLFAFVVFLIIFTRDEIKKFLLERNYWEIFILMLAFIGMYSLIIPTNPKYLLPIFPVFALLTSNAMSRIFKNKAFIILLLFVLLSAFQFHGDSDATGFVLENNLEYQDFIEVRQLGASYIESNFADKTILTTFPLTLDLQYPYGKYVREGLDVVTIERHAELASKNYTLYANPELNEKDIKINSIDVYYHSPQEFSNQRVQDIRDQLDLELVKRFEVNNKVTEIYVVK